jgi:adenylate kinase family enzyme
LCRSLAEKNGFVHLNVGELLKAKSTSNCTVGKSIKAQIATGQLVTSETVVSLLKEKIGNKGGKFLVDGFPKSFENLDQWNK